MAKANKIEKLLKKGKVNVAGHIYKIEKHGEHVDLVPTGDGDTASSTVNSDAYPYTHGGTAYRKAVQAAWEIAEHLTEQRKKGADY